MERQGPTAGVQGSAELQAIQQQAATEEQGEGQASKRKAKRPRDDKGRKDLDKGPKAEEGMASEV